MFHVEHCYNDYFTNVLYITTKYFLKNKIKCNNITMFHVELYKNI